VPPAVALLNYIGSGILWGFFWDISRGFLIINFFGRISETGIGEAGDIKLATVVLEALLEYSMESSSLSHYVCCAVCLKA
jgi:hypothetical protein